MVNSIQNFNQHIIIKSELNDIEIDKLSFNKLLLK